MIERCTKFLPRCYDCSNSMPRPDKGIVAQGASFSDTDDLHRSGKWLHAYRELGDFTRATQSVGPANQMVPFEERTTIQCLAKDLYGYITNTVEAGEYVLDLGNSCWAVVKNKAGQVYLYNAEVGCIDLKDNEGWFSELLRFAKVPIYEKVLLYKAAANPVDTCKESTVVISPACSVLPVFEIEQNPASRYGLARFSFRDETSSFVRDSTTGYIYNADDTLTIRIKCAILAPFTALLRTAAASYNLALGIFSKESREAAARNFVYGWLGVGASLYGLISPYEGRRLYSICERTINQDEQKIDRHGKLYLAACFQPVNYNHKDKESDAESLKRYVLWRKFYLS